MKKVFSRLNRLMQSAWFAYLALALLQLKVIWRMWDYKDITLGDTAYYFKTAYVWFEQFRTNLLWSPLYTSFYGSLLHFIDDSYAVTILHRLIIIFLVSILVLAVMRKLLPAPIAWMMSAWWVVLPINFNTLYEVHLFSVILPLLACLIALSRDRILARGITLALIFGSSLFVRNEHLLATILLGILFFCWEIKVSGLWKNIFNKGELNTAIVWFKSVYLPAYGLPLLWVGGLFGLLALRSKHDFATIMGPMKDAKHIQNVCQSYAFAYQQRHPEWTNSPWSECYQLMEETFGKPKVSFIEAFQIHPQAILEHLGWNISLAPSGLQLALFNAVSGNVNPDYARAALGVKWVIVPSVIVLFLVVSGIIASIRNPRSWWNQTNDKIPGGLVLIAMSALAVFVIIPMQRPRPSYLFMLTIFIMAVVGMSLSVLLRHWLSSKVVARIMPLVMVVMILLVPNYYRSSQRPLFEIYRQLLPFQSSFANSNTVFLSVNHGTELCLYLGKSQPCQSLSYGEVFPPEIPNRPIHELLKEHDVNVFYIHQKLLTQLETLPQAQQFLNHSTSVGWQLLASYESTMSKWRLYKKI